MSMDGVARVVGHQCQLGAESEDGHPIKKPTGFMINARGIAKALSKLCKGRSSLHEATKWPTHEVSWNKFPGARRFFQ